MCYKNIVEYIISLFTHLDQHLLELITFFGPQIYLILFLIIFAETGLVIMPFLPGDSLLFAIGALTALGGPLDLGTILISLTVAAVLGDGVNYHVGKYIGPKVFNMKSRFINPEHLEQTKDFYNRWGSFAIVAARFAPIVRTFAPFVAGVAEMNYKKFLAYNVIGAIAWIFTFVLAGYFFGNAPIVKRNFQYVILAVIVISLLPILIQFFKARKKKPPTRLAE